MDEPGRCVMDVARLESLAQQLVARVRYDDPQANLRWLRAELGTDPTAPVSDTERLLFVACIAIPDTERWSRLVAWCSGGRNAVETRVEYRRRYQRLWMRQKRAGHAA